MKYSDLIEKDPTPRMMRTPMAGHYVGCLALLLRMEHAGWVKASCNLHRMKLWDVRVLDKCCDRITAGELPKR